jgi:hypothetical protein
VAYSAIAAHVEGRGIKGAAVAGIIARLRIDAIALLRVNPHNGRAPIDLLLSLAPDADSAFVEHVAMALRREEVFWPNAARMTVWLLQMNRTKLAAVWAHLVPGATATPNMLISELYSPTVNAPFLLRYASIADIDTAMTYPLCDGHIANIADARTSQRIELIYHMNAETRTVRRALFAHLNLAWLDSGHYQPLNTMLAAALQSMEKTQDNYETLLQLAMQMGRGYDTYHPAGAVLAAAAGELQSVEFAQLLMMECAEYTFLELDAVVDVGGPTVFPKLEVALLLHALDRRVFGPLPQSRLKRFISGAYTSLPAIARQTSLGYADKLRMARCAARMSVAHPILVYGYIPVTCLAPSLTYEQTPQEQCSSTLSLLLNNSGARFEMLQQAAALLQPHAAETIIGALWKSEHQTVSITPHVAFRLQPTMTPCELLDQLRDVGVSVLGTLDGTCSMLNSETSERLTFKTVFGRELIQTLYRSSLRYIHRDPTELQAAVAVAATDASMIAYGDVKMNENDADDCGAAGKNSVDDVNHCIDVNDAIHETEYVVNESIEEHTPRCETNQSAAMLLPQIIEDYYATQVSSIDGWPNDSPEPQPLTTSSSWYGWLSGFLG